jgi:hypothetical protein
MRSFSSKAHRFLSMLIGITVFVQMFLAGLWHSGSVATPDAHIFTGLGLLLASLLALIASLVAGNDSKVTRMTALLFILILLQPIIMEARRNGLPFISSFHALNAAIIGMVSGVVVKMAQTAPVVEDAVVVMPAVSGD